MGESTKNEELLQALQALASFFVDLPAAFDFAFNWQKPRIVARGALLKLAATLESGSLRISMAHLCLFCCSFRLLKWQKKLSIPASDKGLIRRRRLSGSRGIISYESDVQPNQERGASQIQKFFPS